MARINKLWLCLTLIAGSTIVFAQATVTKLSLSGLKEEVTISRDYRGIPYIQAKNDDDLYFAQGYVTASDRLWQMELFRRVAAGETAEIFGARTLDEDKRWRKLGFTRIANESIPFLSEPLKNALESYANGVNAYIEALDDSNLPIEFKILQFKPRRWVPTDTLLIGKILADGLSTTWRNDLLRSFYQRSLTADKYADATGIITPLDVVLFGSDVVKGRPAESSTQTDVEVAEIDLQMGEKEARTRERSLERIGLYAEELAASNNWVISGRRTEKGQPILANDPHLQATTPGIWYLIYLGSPNTKASGVSLPGSPGVTLGHNEYIAWGATNVGPDVQDIYLEQFNKEGQYKTPKGWELPLVRKEEIRVRKNLISNETEIIPYEVVETRNGVIYTEEGGNKYALKWTARNPKNQEFEAFYLLNRARNWEDFQKALKTYGGATQNFVYADVRGNIGWIAGGRIPIRKTGDGGLPYDGATDDGEWIGYIPFDELPKIYNPDSGFIVTANQRIVGSSYKYQQIGRDVAAPWRARRIYQLINENPKINTDQVAAIQRDVFSIPHMMLAKELIGMSALSDESTMILKNWNGNMSADSGAALLINAIRNMIADKIADVNKPIPSSVVRERILPIILREKPRRWLPNGFSDYQEFFRDCDREARLSLEKQFGADRSSWSWGNVFKSNFPHPLGGVPFIGQQFAAPAIGIDGSGVTPNVGSNVSMRLIATPNDWDDTRQVIPMGESGNPRSPHYKDQFQSWKSGELPLFPFSESAIQTAVKETLILHPK